MIFKKKFILPSFKPPQTTGSKLLIYTTSSIDVSSANYSQHSSAAAPYFPQRFHACNQIYQPICSQNTHSRAFCFVPWFLQLSFSENHAEHFLFLIPRASAIITFVSPEPFAEQLCLLVHVRISEVRLFTPASICLQPRGGERTLLAVDTSTQIAFLP